MRARTLSLLYFLSTETTFFVLIKMLLKYFFYDVWPEKIRTTNDLMEGIYYVSQNLIYCSKYLY